MLTATMSHEYADDVRYYQTLTRCPEGEWKKKVYLELKVNYISVFSNFSASSAVGKKGGLD